jgi:hypothetical protein
MDQQNKLKFDIYCLDMNACIQRKEIFEIIKRDFFSNYNNFSKAIDIKQISTIDNINGVVYLITFNYSGYEVTSIIKCGKLDADNIFHEYKVGLFLNNFVNKLPLLVKTYQYFDTCPTSLQYLKQISPGSKKGCDENQRSAIMIEALSPSITLKKFLSTESPINIENELKYILFQIYYTLVYLENEFTHYDLHLENILLHKLSNNTFIEYNYILNDGTPINFKSKYIVKIIDYGRSFYNDTSEGDKIICSEFPFSREYNKSTDLMLLNSVGTNSNTPKNIKDIRLKMSHLYNNLLSNNVKQHYKFNDSGSINTRQNNFKQQTIDLYTNGRLILPTESTTIAQINNINDALQNFVELISSKVEISKNITYVEQDLKMGTVTVFPNHTNKDYLFEFSRDFMRKSEEIKENEIGEKFKLSEKNEFLGDDYMSIGGKNKKNMTNKNNNKLKRRKSKKITRK